MQYELLLINTAGLPLRLTINIFLPRSVGFCSKLQSDLNLLSVNAHQYLPLTDVLSRKQYNTARKATWCYPAH